MFSEKDPCFEMIRRVESALSERQTRRHLRTQWELQLVSKEKKKKDNNL